jgi:hypothetical protein
MSDLNVNPSELRVSAHMADTVNGKDMDDRISQALAGTDSAAISLHGWSISSEIDALAGTWTPALRGLQERLSAAANALRDCAISHEWNETLIGRDFEGV